MHIANHKWGPEELYGGIFSALTSAIMIHEKIDFKFTYLGVEKIPDSLEQTWKKLS